MKTCREDVARCLAEIIRYQENGKVPESLPRGLDADQLLKIAYEHQIMGYVGQVLLAMEGVLEEEKREEIHNVCLNLCFKAMIQKKEADVIQDLLEKNKIKNVLLKGYYMRQYYPKPELREMSDIDLCVEEKALDEVIPLMESLGYTFVKRISNHDIYKKEPCITVEVHKNLFKGEIDKNQHDYYSSMDKMQYVEGKNYSYKQNLEDFYIYMTSHMAGHFYKRGCGIRNLIDFYIFNKRFENQLDRKYIDAQLLKCGLSDFEYHISNLSQMWLGDRPFKEFYYDLFEYMLNCGIYGKTEYGIWNEYAHVQDNKKNNSQFHRKLWYLLPPLHYMKKYYSFLRKIPFLLPVAWIVRIIRGAFFRKSVVRRDYLKRVSEKDIDMIQNIYRKVKLDFEPK
ncbi:Uncharacterised nucleotidyltransferase [Acetitomaculum ruminis DSM 5522]|uniref:Uncharacterized nucleotidyltransferase n=1 Tax=Acetitomaculum ruminis DSM 5522 TaxID=1120918 RepID=A0A1I0Z172_9FIRM|nr:nucleotidyltransferase family protein [Acetitomaculum ruminis]SFB19142.1 Uncharacterised nucleotidyltransferase [Acetitomaculum ruminis DSM 5522]